MCSLKLRLWLWLMGFFFLTPGPCTLPYNIGCVGVVRIFPQSSEVPSFPGFILGRVTGILQLKLGSSWEWGGACCFRKSSHYLGKCLLNFVNDGDGEKKLELWGVQDAEHGGQGIGRVQHLTAHTPGLFWGLELKVLCDITGRLRSVLSLPASERPPLCWNP